MSSRTLPTLLACALGAAAVTPALAQQEAYTLDRFDFDLDGDGLDREPIMGEPPAFLDGYVRTPIEPAAPPPVAEGELPGGELPGAIPISRMPEAPLGSDELPPVATQAAVSLPSVSDMDPSGAFAVAPGQGMGHVAQALLAAIEADGTVARIPDLWVPPAGGRVGLPHVVACYNRREPDDWSVRVDEVLALPPLHQVWPIIEHLKAEGTCPAEIQVPRKQAVLPEPAEGMEDFEFGGAFKVAMGRTFSHYASAARHYLAAHMPADDIPPLYPAPGRFGILHLMACFNSGDSQALDIRAGQLLRVPPPIAIPEAARFLDEHGGACPPDFRPAGTAPRGAVAARSSAFPASF